MIMKKIVNLLTKHIPTVADSGPDLTHQKVVLDQTMVCPPAAHDDDHNAFRVPSRGGEAEQASQVTGGSVQEGRA